MENRNDNKIYSIGGRVLNSHVFRKVLKMQRKCYGQSERLNWSNGFYRKRYRL